METTPCYACKKRKVGCHSTCTGKGSYQEWREKKDKINEKRYRELQAVNDADALRSEGIKNVTRGIRK